MTLRNVFFTAIKGLRANRMRSFLTLLGIVIGIAAIILVMSVGQGAQELILSQIRGLGSQTISVEPGREPQGPSSFTELFTDSLKERDFKALQDTARVPGVKDISPVVFQVAPVSSESDSIRTNIIGSSDLMATILDIYPSQGVFFSDDDIKEKASVAVLGSKVKGKLFGLSDAVGGKVKIKGRTFRVVGVLSPKGQVSFLNVDDMIVVPYTTAQQYLLGIDYFQEFIVQAESEEMVPDIVNDIKATLREMHGITDPSKDDFHIMTQADAVQRVGMVTGILTALLTSIAAISLLVGGIGIMNIMFVSVTERTREIGLRKALGATNKDILLQFLLEAVLLTAIGGLIGVLLGAFLSFVVSMAMSKFVAAGWAFTFPVFAALIGLAVSGFIGLIFGLYPARQASRKNPIESLRYE